MHLWLVSTASFHTFLVRAENEDQARAVAMDGPEGDTASCAAELGYRESGTDPASWDVQRVTLDGDLLHGEPLLIDTFS